MNDVKNRIARCHIKTIEKKVIHLILFLSYTLKKPAAVIDYNKSKNEVDIFDQMAVYNTPVRKSMKWCRNIILEIIGGTAIVNAWNLYNNCSDNKKNGRTKI